MLFLRVSAGAAVLIAGAMLISCSAPAGNNSVIPTYAMGDRAQAGPVIYTLFENRWLAQLGTPPASRIPQNRFFMLRLSMVNSGSSEVIAPGLTLIDDNGQRYQELSDGDGVPQWIGYVRRIKPADTLTGNILFDVPPKHYKLEVTDEMEEKKALIDIPLSFGSEAPGVVPVPGAAPPDQPSPFAPK
jgi:hypothetical protein